tara:strand:+ start:191 stop:433 length:243 start_codon:yes stop_codon:yes gene_type:complete
MIEVTLNTIDIPEQEWQYPCLVVGTNGVIVYATGDGNASYTSFAGVTINTINDWVVGMYSTTWTRDNFKLYTHPITLKNI